MMHSLTVSLGSRSYPISIGVPDGIDLGLRWREVLGNASKFVLICDTSVVELARQMIAGLGVSTSDVAMIEVPSGEQSKSVEQLQRLWSQMALLRADRKTVVVAVGGGVIGDLAGFLAATWNRGLRFMQVPTTLLAMVDSSVGGKTGINLPAAKNVIGAFWQPSLVWIDLRALRTLPEREYLSGLAEVVKYGVILDESFFEWLEGNVDEILGREPSALEYLVKRCCELKARVVAEDEHETTGLRAILNYGHTFGHAIEALARYGTYLHGEAISIGMTMAGTLSAKLGLWPIESLDRQTRLLGRFSLPVLLGSHDGLTAATMLEAMRLDKKTSHGKFHLILPTKLGQVQTFSDVSIEDMVGCIEACQMAR
jgi:3-dehydroquinate synthase